LSPRQQDATLPGAYPNPLSDVRLRTSLPAMLLLHAGLDEGQLLVWGETPPEMPARRGRKPRRSSAPWPLPFGAGADPLAAALAEVLPSGRRPPEKEDPAFVWLPTRDGRPFPSS